jgi:4-amino-4-deoxy-L-arabinose transferase-like glycosyltransferase
MNIPFSKFWPWFFFTAAFESLLAVVALLLVPSESELSIARIGLLGILTFFFLTGIYLGFFARRDASRFEKFSPAIIFPALLFLASGLILFLLRYLNPERFLPYYERLGPLFWYLLVISFQSIVFFSILRYGFHPRGVSQRKPIYLSALFAFGGLFLVFLFVSVTKIGITFDQVYWGEPGIAILGWQFALSILIGFSIFLYALHFASHDSPIANYILPIFIYLTAVTLWLTVPVSVLQNSFYAPITPPTNIPLPYSDAGYYDYLSQSLLIGTDYFGGIPPRPLYVVFLAALHFLFGQNYPAIISAQTCVLALFPVALYLLGKKLHSPAAGVTAALFAIFRELVGLWVSSNTRVANSKILTTDFPTAMALALLCFVLIYWLEKRDLKATVIAGGFFGLTLLFRTQSLLILPVVFFLAWFVYQRKTKDWVIAGACFAVPMVLTVAPWLGHNYMVTGKIAFDDPAQMATLYSQYTFSRNNEYQNFDPEKESLQAKIISFTLENPSYVAGFAANHFLNTEIGGLLALPLIERFDGLFAPVNLYWVEWDGTVTWYNLILLVVYLSIIAVGFGSAWQRTRWIGLLPLAINIGYALSNAVSRFSSWRYNMPVDWVVYFYFAIGIMEILGGIILLFGVQAEKIFPAEAQMEMKPITLRDFRPQYILFIFVFMFVGATPWLAKGLAPQWHTSTQEQLIARFESSGYDGNEIRTFLSQPEGLMLEGRILYPRMYRRTEGMSSAHPWAAYKVRDYPRLSFILINEQHYDTIFPTRDLLDFPQGADVIALACQQEDHIEIRIIEFNDQTFSSASVLQPCSSR